MVMCMTECVQSKGLSSGKALCGPHCKNLVVIQRRSYLLWLLTQLMRIESQGSAWGNGW